MLSGLCSLLCFLKNEPAEPSLDFGFCVGFECELTGEMLSELETLLELGRLVVGREVWVVLGCVGLESLLTKVSASRFNKN